MADLIYGEEVYRIVGCAMEVYNTLGSGFLEGVYQEAMELELADRGIEFRSQPPLRIQYKERTLEKEYFPDLICMGKVIVELKALGQLSGKEKSRSSII